jgi:hypothetical protein
LEVLLLLIRDIKVDLDLLRGLERLIVLPEAAEEPVVLEVAVLEMLQLEAVMELKTIFKMVL